MQQEQIVKQIAVTAEVCGATVSAAVLGLMAKDLSRYPSTQVLGALDRCRREVSGRFTLASIIERLDDGRPGPEAAWALCPMSESDSAYWTEEAAQAYFTVCSIDDETARRMAFREEYKRRLQVARGDVEPVNWWFSQGLDVDGRLRCLQSAVSAGYLQQTKAQKMLPAGFLDDEPPVSLEHLKQEALKHHESELVA